ncbi:MAG: hypothetical protein HOP27_00140 [Anaerolineales bacterium]|nr:hypothetical protein [Anaerolineales bacterium]
MTGINHKQAHRYLRAAADGLLRENQRALLDAHLRDCASCRAEADELNALEARLKKNFQARWDAHDGPSTNVMTTIHSRSRRIIMTNRINTGLKTLAGIAALLVLGLIFSSVIRQLQKSSTNISAPISPAQQAIGADKSNGGLLAFVSEKSGDPEIYTMYADGSELANLTNNPAQDMNPVWSPDGKRIAFESDRTGFRQIFLMNADGSDVTQLTVDKADHWIGEPYNLSLNLWSPDGNKLIFSQIVPGEENGILYSIDANGENKKPLVNEAGKYSSPSWSPDGKQIAFIVFENSVTRIYSTDADGNNLTNVTKILPSDETLYPVNYSWSRDGQSISFIASNWNSLLGGGGSGENYKWTAYEASLDGNTLITNAKADSQIGGYWDGTYFLSGSAIVSSSPAFTWVRSDGTITTANPIENCHNLLDSNTGGYSSYKQSSNGNVVIGAYCPNGDKWLFWANSTGTVRSLLNSPIHVEGTTSNAMHLWAPSDFIWSPDDKYIAFNIFSLGKTDMYIVNVNESLKDPSIQPFQIAIGNGSLYYSPSWQPRSDNNDIVEYTSTPEPLEFSLTVEEAEKLAGFDVLEPSYLPEGYIFNGASYNSGARWVALEFISQLEGSEYSKVIYILQRRGTFDLGPALHPYETPVPIGDVEGVFIRGAYVYESPDTTAYKWDASADSYALSWKIDDMAFSINFLGGETIPPIPLADLVAIAESMK